MQRVALRHCHLWEGANKIYHVLSNNYALPVREGAPNFVCVRDFVQWESSTPNSIHSLEMKLGEIVVRWVNIDAADLIAACIVSRLANYLSRSG